VSINQHLQSEEKNQKIKKISDCGEEKVHILKLRKVLEHSNGGCMKP
jgi:hypothetical protein